jgi:hypothetical protein
MRSQFSFTGLSIAVLIFAGTVAMHQAASAEDVYTGSLAPIINELLPDDVFTGSLAPLANKLLSEEIEEDFEGKHLGKHGKKGKHSKNGNHGKNGKHGKKGKHHDNHEGLSTLEGNEDLSILY